MDPDEWPPLPDPIYPPPPPAWVQPILSTVWAPKGIAPPEDLAEMEPLPEEVVVDKDPAAEELPKMESSPGEAAMEEDSAVEELPKMESSPDEGFVEKDSTVEELPKMEHLPDEGFVEKDSAAEELLKMEPLPEEGFVEKDSAAEELPKMKPSPDEGFVEKDIAIEELLKMEPLLDEVVVNKDVAVKEVAELPPASPEDWSEHKSPDLQANSRSAEDKGKSVVQHEECGLSKLEWGSSCYNNTVSRPLHDMEKRMALHPNCTWSQIFRILVSSWKICYLTGTGGWYSVTAACKNLHCSLHVLDNCEPESTVIVSSAHCPDSTRPTAINALLWFHRFITIHRPCGEASSSACQFITRLLARRHHLRDYSSIAEECQTTILVKEDTRFSSLPDDYIIEIHGKKEDVNKTVKLVAMHLNQFPFDDCIASLLYTVPKRVYKSISSNVVTRYVMIPYKHSIHVRIIVDSANIEGGIFATLQSTNSDDNICKLVGGSNGVEHTLRRILQVLEGP